MPKDAMGFKEAVSYGLSTYMERQAERQAYERSNAQLSSADIIVPSLATPVSEVTPSLARAALVTQLTLLKNDDIGITEEHEQVLQRAAEDHHQAARFKASRWSRLFPMLVREPTQTVQL